MTGGQTGAAEDAFREDQRRLGELHRTHLQVQLSHRTLAKVLKVAPTSVGMWLCGETVPQQEESMANLVEQIRKGLTAAGFDPVQLDQELLDPEQWRARYQQVMQERAARVSAGVQGAQAVKALDAAAVRERFAALSDKSRPVPRWTAQQLGVHPAIRGAAVAAAGHEFVVPEYVERAHDRVFRDLLTAAADGERTVVVVLRGGSCTGKTRTAFEGVTAHLGDWQLVFPKDTESLLALLSCDAVPPRTVMWLNEAQELLRGPSGESAAAGLRRLLESAGPVVIVATLWPAEHRELTGRDGANAQARYFLQAATVVDVPEEFTASELRTLEELHDPSLDTATRAGGRGSVTQTLAAGPQLVDHYTNAVPPHGACGRAVITAAMDARRLGHTSPISTAFLKEAAPGYLTQQERATADSDTWFDDALGYAREKVMDVAQALEPVAAPSGMGSLPGVYRLSDFLDHHARAARRYAFPPASFWASAQQHAATAPDMAALADAAAARGRHRIAAAVYRRAADGGESRALVRLARLYESADAPSQAQALFREAADHGESWAWQELIRLEEAAGNTERTEALLREAVTLAGDYACRWMLVERLERAGRHDEAETMAREATAEERVRLLLVLADLRVVFGDVTGAEVLLRETGSEGLYRLGWMKKRAGDLDAAESLLRQAAQTGWPAALYDLAELRREAGDPNGAEGLLNQAAAAGVIPALWDLAMEAEEAGDRPEAERLARLASADGDPDVLQELALRRDADGRHEDAERLAREAGRQGDETLCELAIRREIAGDRSAAERLAREAAALGNPCALRDLVQLRVESGDCAGADTLALEASIAGEPDSLRYLVNRLLEARNLAGAKQLLLDAVNCGHPSALREMAVMRAEFDRDRAGAERIERFGLNGDGDASPEWS